MYAWLHHFLGDDRGALYCLLAFSGISRRELLRVAEREKCRDDRHGTPFCLCLIDIDHFKRINDTYGHLVGDQVLKQISVTIRAKMRGA